MKLTKILSAVLVTFSLSSAAQADSLAMGVGEWAPYVGESIPDNGLHAARVREVMGNVGHDVELKFLPWKRSLEQTKRGDFVATFPWSYAKEREADFIFPKTPLEEQTDNLFYSKKKHPDGISAKSIEDLKAQGLKAVGLAGYWYEAAFKEAGIEIHIVSSEDNAWKFLQAGRADFMIENAVVGGLSVERVLGAGADNIGKGAVFRTVPMYVLFSKAHPDGQKMADAWDANAK